MKKRIFYIAAITLSFLFSSFELQAQPTRAGTHLNSKSIQSSVLQLVEPDEVGRIRQLMVDGKKSDALIASERYVEEVERTLLPHESLKKYYAYNAYCTVLTSHGRVDEAISACSTAMELEPAKWSAVNNRGTANLVGGRVEDALEDYNSALTLVEDGNASAQDTILHNIMLAEERQGR